MPFKDWYIDLGEVRIYIRRDTVAGEVFEFAVVLMAWNGTGWECVTRYDCAHGFPHRDVLGKRGGLLYKETFQGLTVREVFHHAINDCQKNHERHRGFYEAH